MNDSIGTGGLNYHDENFPGENKDKGLGKKNQRMATQLGMTG